MKKTLKKTWLIYIYNKPKSKDFLKNLYLNFSKYEKKITFFYNDVCNDF